MKTDARALDHSTLMELRKRGVAAVQAGEPVAEVAAALGVNRKHTAKAAWTKRREIGNIGAACDTMEVSTKALMALSLMTDGEAGALTTNLDGRREKRHWSREEKRRIVAESFAPGASVSVVARRHDLSANMLFAWRRGAKRTDTKVEALPGFIPARISEEPAGLPRAPTTDPAGRMEIVLESGTRVIVAADVDAMALRRVVKVLSQR
ncbi:MAG: IS66-like element accessory protein TnpA [Gemmataceae bacterium]